MPADRWDAEARRLLCERNGSLHGRFAGDVTALAAALRAAHAAGIELGRGLERDERAARGRLQTSEDV